MSYYIDHIIECDLLTFDRMMEYWKQRRGNDGSEVCRPRQVWAVKKDSDDCVKPGSYLLYLVASHQPNRWEILDWLDEELGVDRMHFTVWTMEMYDKSWSQEGGYVPDDTMPEHTSSSEYDEHWTDLRKTPEGYKTYDDCRMAVDTEVWEEMTVDFTRDVGVHPESPVEDLLLKIDENLDMIEGLLECLLERFEECLSAKKVKPQDHDNKNIA